MGDMRRLVCGSPEVTEAELREFVSMQLGAPYEDWFWQSVRKMEPEDRSLLLYFATGQRRIPLKQPIRVQSKPRSSSTELPTSATCFFAMTIPQYTSAEVLHDRLFYAIRHCQAIDGDGN